MTAGRDMSPKLPLLLRDPGCHLIHGSWAHPSPQPNWYLNQITNGHTRTHTHGPLSGSTQVSPYQKGKTNLDFTEARNSEWQWHQLGNMQACTSLQTVNHASTPPLSFLQAGCPSCCPTNSVKALKAKALKANKWTYSSQYSACLPGWNNYNYIRIITTWHYKYLHCRNVKWCSNSIYRQYDCFVFPVCSNEAHQSSSMQ